MTDTPKFPRKPGETSKDYRERLSRLAGRNYKGKETRQDVDIQAEGDAKSNPTLDQLAPKTPEEIEAAKTGIEEAKKRIGQNTKPQRDADGFLTGRNMLKILQFIPAAAGSFRQILSIGGRI